jgi:tetratricopeptide (TPR) repeat protein
MLSRARQQLVPLTGKGRGDSVDAQQAVSMAESMHEMNRELLGIEADEAQQSALVLGHAYDRAGRLADGERVYREMLDITLRQADRKRDHAYMRYTLGGNLRRQGAPRAAEARKLLEQAIADWGTLDKPPFARCEALLELAFVAGIEAKYDEQRALLEQGVACAEANSPAGHFRQREAWGFMADFLRERGEFDAARTWYAKALDGLAGNTTDAFTRAWMDAWRGEILWMTCEDARRSGHEASAEAAGELRSIVERTKQRDLANPRLPRWTAAIESHPG